MTIESLFWLAVGMNIGAASVFGLIAARWSARHAATLASELIRWLESR